MSEIRRLSIQNDKIVFPDMQRQLTEAEAALLELDLYKKIHTPYNKKIEHLNAQFQRVIDVARFGSDKQIRGVLGEKIVDDIGGTFLAMRMLADSLGVPVPGIAEVGKITAIFLDALTKLYISDDVQPLRELASKYEKQFGLPVLPQPVGRKKGTISPITRFAGEWAERLYKSNEFTDYTQVAQRMLNELETKPKKQRTDVEQKLYTELRGQKYEKRGGMLSQWVRRYRSA